MRSRAPWVWEMGWSPSSSTVHVTLSERRGIPWPRRSVSIELGPAPFAQPFHGEVGGHVGRVSARTIIVVTAIVAVAGVATLAYSWSKSPAAMLGVVVAPRDAALSVSNQRSAAERLVVDRLLAPGPSWV